MIQSSKEAFSDTNSQQHDTNSQQHVTLNKRKDQLTKGVKPTAATTTTPASNSGMEIVNIEVADQIEWVECDDCKEWRVVPDGSEFDRANRSVCSSNQWGEQLECGDPSPIYPFVEGDDNDDDDDDNGDI